MGIGVHCTVQANIFWLQWTGKTSLFSPCQVSQVRDWTVKKELDLLQDLREDFRNHYCWSTSSHTLSYSCQTACPPSRHRSILLGAEVTWSASELPSELPSAEVRLFCIFHLLLQNNKGNLFSKLRHRNLSSMGFHSSFGAIIFWWVWSFTSHALCEIFVSFPFGTGSVFVFLLNWSRLWTEQVHTVYFTSTVSKNLKLFSQHMSSPEKCLIAWLSYFEAL